MTGLLENGGDPGLIVGPHVPRVQFDHVLELIRPHNLSFENKKVLDFGCGAHRPLSAALVFHLCGAREVTAIDLEPFFDEGSIAVGLVAQCLGVMFDRDFFDLKGAGLDYGQAMTRLGAIALDRLLDGDIRSGLPESIRWRHCFYEELPEQEQLFDVMVSHTVFEHVADPKTTLMNLRRNMSPDGFGIIVIDYKDHRAYAGTAPSYYQYLMDDLDHMPGYINKIRHSAFVDIVASAGFEVLECVRERMYPSQEERNQFLPRYASLSEDDITTSGARILIRPI
ncbi:class I SAM-dependent methyltransferase [Sphingobium scionense]|uniref:SAM-dependent methyltransferase n=1 Tax=Sphingobium scionense TaxID=1404341 RepID=A0A7W6PXH8_9SPHN|nr:methyltransferase domain-containing protein [Sphingobium scionense]MBB4150284.1 SAM-dependent methyltransferase [Sphingobium scionense]